MKRDIAYPFRITDVNTANDFHWNGDFVFLGERHDFWEIVCVLDGSVEVVEDEKVYILSPSDMILHAPLEFHRIKSRPGTNPHVYILSFNSEGALPERLAEGVFHLSDELMAEFCRTFADWYAYLKEGADEGVGAVAGLRMSSFLIELSKKGEDAPQPENSAKATEYRKIVDVMQKAVSENLTLPRIAARAAVSLTGLKLLFSEFSGLSPKRYYAELRINEAKKLLKSGHTVARVSELLGFSSPNYFSTFYKRYGGRSAGSEKD